MALSPMSSNLSDSVYTAITFAPVQGFIEKSRKLRDLYGSSLILSYLSDSICNAAIETAKKQTNNSRTENPSYPVVSPALLKLARGTPNKIILEIEFSKELAKTSFDQAWSDLVNTYQQWLDHWLKQELKLQPMWGREWSLWRQHTWEFFWAKGTTIQDAIAGLDASKQPRHWVGINWTGESSTISGADAVAYPNMSCNNPKYSSQSAEDEKIKTFYQQLSQKLPETIIDERETLSIPELVKRLVTVNEISSPLKRAELPHSYKPVNRWQEDNVTEIERKESGRWTGWFMGDGDQVGVYLKKLLQQISKQHNIDERNPEAQVLYAKELQNFSSQMRNWGENLGTQLPKAEKPYKSLDYNGRIIYAGGDDFLGVLYRNEPDPKLTAQDCLSWFYRFNDIWKSHKQDITVSVGFVWAASNIPQRDILQHCREAEQSAKANGRDRLAIRILFNDGNYLEWACPWQYLPILQHYRDRNKKKGATANWNHLFEDIATLEARHAFRHNTDVAIALFNLYFDPEYCPNLQDQTIIWNQPGRTGLLGEGDRFPTLQAKQNALNHWIINLAKVGFHLHRKPTAIGNLTPSRPPQAA